MKIVSTFLLCFTFAFALFAQDEQITLTIIDPVQELYVDNAEIYSYDDNHLIGKTDLNGNFRINKNVVKHSIVITKNGYVKRVYDISKISKSLEISLEIDPSKKLNPVEAAPEKNSNSDRKIESFVDEAAHFQDNYKALMSYIQNNLVYPQYAIEHDLRGKVYLKFVVEADGRITNVNVIRGASPCLDREAVRVISEMPNWVPGKLAGVNVASYFQLPLNFFLE